MAKPRVFVSSTYYDLKYARERLERFIKSYNMEPVLFESDDVYFNPSQEIDKSCYKEVEKCHLMLLIVGGRYGSYASDPNNPDSGKAKEKYDKEYVSITQREYETAVENNIPVLICVEKNVYGDYETFLRNKNNNPHNIVFAHTDDYKVFDFISIFERSHIKFFDKIEDIEVFFSNQISGMLFTYLEQLRKQVTRDGLKTTLEQIQTASKSMQDMLNSIAEKIFESEKGKYEKLLEQQQKDLIDFFFTIFKQNFKIDDLGLNEDEAIKAVDNICNILKQTILEINRLDTITYEDNHRRTRRAYSIKTMLEVQKTCKKELTMRYPSMKIEIDILKLRSPLLQVLNKIKDNSTLQLYFDQQLKQIIEWEINRYLLRMRILSQTMDISSEDE